MTISAAHLAAFRSTAYIGLGSNLDHPDWQVKRALREIDDISEAALVRVSSLYRTAPVGIVDQPHFVNAVAEVATVLSPHDLLAALREIEERHGRVRNPDAKNGPRTLDLDMLMFNDWRIDDAQLTTPHPRMHARAFVMVPLAEIAPNLVVPGNGKAHEILAALDRCDVFLLDPPLDESAT